MASTPTILQLIAALEAQTQPNTINPTTIGTILRAINTIVDAANTSATNAQNTALTASATATTALNTINTSQAAVNAQVLAQIQALLNTVNTRTQLTPTTFGGPRMFAYDDCAIPYYENDIDFTLGYETIMVKISGTSTTTLALDDDKQGTCYEALLKCSGDTDLEQVIAASPYASRINLFSNKMLYADYNYIMRIYRCIDTTIYSAYDSQHATYNITITKI